MPSDTECAGQRFILTAEGNRHPWLLETITGTQLRELLGCGPEVPLLREQEDGGWVELSDSDSFDLRHPHHHKVRHRWCYLFEGQEFTWPKRFILGSDLRTQHQVPAGTPLVQENADGHEVDIQDTDRVDLGRPCRFGVKAQFRRGLCPRWEMELALLRKFSPELRVDERGWVELPAFKLPADLYNRTDDTVSFLIPAAYPQAGPDNFYVSPGLRFNDNRPLTNHSEGAGPFGGTYGVFSFHPASWRPAASPVEGDSLLSFLRAVRQRLAEAA